MTKNLGSTLVEVLMALLVLGIAVPPALDTLGSVLTAGIKVHDKAHMVSSSEWWFARLAPPVSAADIDAAPKTDPHGNRFEWRTENLPGGTIRVTLYVHGQFPNSVFTISRVF